MRPTDLHSDTIPICDYEGSDYRTRFWGQEERAYEDLAERYALRRLLPQNGTRLLEVGTGFGRLVDLYHAYDQIILLDYSKSLLRQAQERLGRDDRYVYVAADVYRMPLADAVVDTVSMVRVIHHLANVPGALRQVRRVLSPGGALLLEFASKLHLKSILRYAVRRQSWSPFSRSPIEFAELNFDFHPQWMFERLREQGLAVERIRTVSRFRIPLLKRLVPPRVLAGLDAALQGLGALWQLTPSVFVRARREEGHAVYESPGRLPSVQLFRCPSCERSQWRLADAELHCLACGARWAIDDGIYDFKAPAHAAASR
ncbi:MAG: class I SAM-dependent methyltransferase [Anaerolineae bacterium]|nr:class I SAM-dependent methyltransferase [Anaerolineae bacterium]